VDTAGNHETANNSSIGIDSTPPVSRVAPLPAIAPSQYIYLQWSASDATSGLAMTCQKWNQRNFCIDHNYGFNIYLSTDNGPFTLMATNVTYNPNTPFLGQFGHTYAFYSITEDLAGNVENKWTADTVTTVPAQLSAYDLNGDGYVDCGDVAIVKASFGKKAGQTGFDPRADVNHDGVVDVRDLAAVTQKLMPGSSCH
jgi:hypothetical protein